MERMTRNGLLTIIAVLMAFALPLCLKNVAQAQQLAYLPNDPVVNGLLGEWVTLEYDDKNGNTYIKDYEYAGYGLTGALNQQTNNQYGTVFWNDGLYSYYYGTPTNIIALNEGTMISTISGAPAIQNGTPGERPRLVLAQYVNYIIATELPGGGVFITFWEQAFDLMTGLPVPGTMAQIPFADLPPGLQNFDLLGDGTITYDAANNYIFIPAPYTVSLETTPGVDVTNPYAPWITVYGQPINGNPPPVIGMMPSSDIRPMDTVNTASATPMPGRMTINDRGGSRDLGESNRFHGNARTLIEAPVIAIHNIGDLEISDSRIQAGQLYMDGSWYGGVGISHEYPRESYGYVTGRNPVVTYDFYTSGVLYYSQLLLFNTKIGESTGNNWYIDPFTRENELVTGDGIEMEMGPDGEERPKQTITWLLQGDEILNDRIVVGQGGNGIFGQDDPIELKRNPIGSIVNWLRDDVPGGFEAERTLYHTRAIQGPSIGIHAYVTPTIRSDLDPDWGGAMLDNYDDVYQSGYIDYVPIQTTPAISQIVSNIDLLDNSWIFAETGISFGGGAGAYSSKGGIRVTVDETSGIYSMGSIYGQNVQNFLGAAYDSEFTPLYQILYRNGLDGGYGITDRYSIVGLLAMDPRPTPVNMHIIDGYRYGYSGSFHEIWAEGKVIAGAPSRAGIWFNPNLDVAAMSDLDKKMFSSIYYYDPDDPYAINAPGTKEHGRVYYYDPKRGASENAEVAQKFVAYNDQPNRVFWGQFDGDTPIQLTYYDHASQRWMVHPNAPTTGVYSNPLTGLKGEAYFTPFDRSFGVGIDIVGTSMAWEGAVYRAPAIPPAAYQPWTAYYGPTVREILIRGDEALVTGGDVFSLLPGFQLYGLTAAAYTENNGGGAGIHIGTVAHVAKIVIGSNKDVKNLSDVLFVAGVNGSSGRNTLTSDPVQTAKNFNAFDTMTSVNRSKFLYDPALAYSNDENKFQFDNAGVHGDIISFYNAVAGLWTGTGGSWDGITWNGGDYTMSAGSVPNFWWQHGTFAANAYNNEVLGVDATNGPSYLLGHRDSVAAGTSATASDIPGRSLILDELLINYLAGNSRGGFITVAGSSVDSYGYANDGNAADPRHFREALARFIHYNSIFVDVDSWLSIPELLAGYTRDGTLLIFSNGDIFSGNIYGGGMGDPLNREMYLNVETGTGGSSSFQSVTYGNYGNIDVRIADGTTIFNRNVIEYVIGSDIYRDAGIRVRDLYVEETGHLLVNDAIIAVNPFATNIFAANDYAERLIIHDVLNEGIISGNGVFMIGQRYDNRFLGVTNNTAVDYFEGYFINRGILAPGLSGMIGEDAEQARQIEGDYYKNAFDTLRDTAGDQFWESLIRGVPGGQFGAITIFGSLQLMDEHTRPVYYDPSNHAHNGPLYNTLETLPASQYHATIGNDTIGDVLGKYAATIRNATSAYYTETRNDGTTVVMYDESLIPSGELSREDWQTIAAEKLNTQLSWFSPSAFVDSQTRLPLLTAYEQFEYLTDPERRTQLQRKMIETVLTDSELRLYDSNLAERARLNRKMFENNNIQFALTDTDRLLMRFGFSDVVSVFGTVPPYLYDSASWGSTMYNLGTLRSPSNLGNEYLGITHLGGIVQADRILDLDDDAHLKEKQTSFIIIASEGYTGDGIKQVTSATTDWVFANVSVLPIQLATGQTPAVLTVIDDPNYYRNRVSMAGDSHNAKAVAGALDDAMLTNPGLAMAFQFGLNSPEVFNDVFRQAANGTRANSVIMNLTSPSDGLFNHIGYGTGGLSTGNRGNVTYRNAQTGQLQQPFGQPAVPPPGQQFAPPMAGQYRGQSPMYRTGSVWGAFTHSNFTMGDDDNSFKYSYYKNGGMIGNEWNLTPSSVIGGVFTFGEGTLTSLSDKVNSVDYTFGLYFVAAPYEQFELKSYFGGGYQSYKTDRYIRNSDVFVGYDPTHGQNGVFGIDDHYNSESSGQSFNWSIEFARPFTVSPNFVIRPAAGYEFQCIQQNAYSDRKGMGAGSSWAMDNPTNIAGELPIEGARSGTFGLNYDKMTFSRSLVRFGINTESYFARGGWRFRAYHVGRLAGDRQPISEQSFTSGSKVFGVRGADLGNSYAQVGTGLHFWLNQDRTATIFFNGDWNFSLNNRGYSMLNLASGVQLNF